MSDRPPIRIWCDRTQYTLPSSIAHGYQYRDFFAVPFSHDLWLVKGPDCGTARKVGDRDCFSVRETDRFFTAPHFPLQYLVDPEDWRPTVKKPEYHPWRSKVGDGRADLTPGDCSRRNQERNQERNWERNWERNPERNPERGRERAR